MSKKIYFVLVILTVLISGCSSDDMYVIKNIGNVTYNFTIVNGSSIVANSIECADGSVLFNVSINESGDLSGLCVLSGVVGGSNETLIIADECLDVSCSTLVEVAE